LNRTAYSPGIILNVGELAALAHIPDPDQMPEALEVAGTGSAAPRIAKENILTPLGWNRYGGADTPVGISEEWMTRHVAVFGASGSGKSNLLSLFLSLVEEE
jgi:DNA helicase HerA-like ATPase